MKQIRKYANASKGNGNGGGDDDEEDCGTRQHENKLHPIKVKIEMLNH